MGRTLAFVYGVVVYVISLATILYAIGFVGNILVPKSIDSGTQGGVGMALTVNLALLCLFAVQHSVMARPAFKRVWTRVVPKAVERSTYVLMSSGALILIFLFWQPMTATVWVAGDTALGTALSVLFWAGWFVVLASTFMIDHLDLFGLKQVYAGMKERGAVAPGFLKIGFYRLVRHPIMTGFLIAFWATPSMTTGHLLFALVCTGYIVVAVLRLEERDLIAQIGDEYLTYRREVPAFIPFIRGKR